MYLEGDVISASMDSPSPDKTKNVNRKVNKNIIYLNTIISQQS